MRKYYDCDENDCDCGCYEEYLNEASTDSLIEELNKRQKKESNLLILDMLKENTNNPYLFKRFVCDYLEVGYHIHTNEELAEMLKNKM